MRLAHLTDLHLRRHLAGTGGHARRRCREGFDLLAPVLAGLAGEGVDLLVLTGDLIDAPLSLIAPDDYHHDPAEAWRPAAVRDYRALKSLLDACGLPYLALPGNHDHLPSFFEVFAPAAERELPPEWWMVQQAGWQITRFVDREHDGHVPRRFDRERKRFDALVPGGYHAGSAGRLPVAHRDHPVQPQIHLQHYVLHPRCDQHYPHTYREADELVERLARSRVRLALSGHYHPGHVPVAVGGCHFAIGAAFCESPHPYRVFELSDQHCQWEDRCAPVRPGRPRPVVFLDRDGVISAAGRFLEGPSDLVLLPGAGQALVRLHRAGYAVVVVSNQGGVGLGHLLLRTVEATNDRMARDLVAQADGNLAAQPDLVQCCYGHGKAVLPEYRDLTLRKPRPDLLDQAVQLLDLDRHRAWMVGDRLSDLETGHNYGIPYILVRTGHGHESEASLPAHPHLQPQAVVDDLTTAVDRILAGEHHG